MKTSMSTINTREREWLLIDGENQILGRLATQLSKILQGKHKPTYIPHVDTGDFVVIINADKIRVTGNKKNQKAYFHHTGYMGGLRETSYESMKANKPEQILKMAVKRMLPKTKMGKEMLKKLKIYMGSEHPHTAQRPRTIDPVKKYKIKEK